MLNTEQEKAVRHIEGPLLILAGAGAGKTHTLTQRVAYLIKDIGIKPESVLCVTFTNKASKEMKERIGSFLGVETEKMSFYKTRNFPLIGTFHSIGVYFLRLFIDKIGYEKNFIIYDEDDKIKLVKDILEAKNIDTKEFPARKVAYAIGGAKNLGVNAMVYSASVGNYFQQVVSDVFGEYEKRLKAYNALDFDDILLKTFEILNIKEVLDYFHERFQYFLVDEYQDTNEMQYRIVNLLASKTRNICVVGDDWQGIYSWRGANIQNIFHFQRDYKDCHVVKLEQNYRSTKNIIHCANCVIKNNSGILDKTLWTDNEQGSSIKVIEAYNEKNEAESVAENIKVNIDSGENFAVLYRTNGQSRLIEEALLNKGIPYKVYGGVKFYERKEIKDILAYIRLIANRNDIISLKRIINVPSRKIGQKSVEVLMEYAYNYGLSPIDVMDNIDEVTELGPQARNSIRWFKEMYVEFSDFIEKNSIESLMREIIKKTGYEEYLLDEYGKDECEGKLDNLKEFENMASRYAGLESREALNMFLEDIALITDADREENSNIKVSLMTVHLSKGLEFDNVFIVGSEEGIFPHSRSLLEAKELEEERRLMYVAMTRAKKNLYISRAFERYTFGNYSANPPSRFLKEIPEEYMEKLETKKNSFGSFFSDSKTSVSFDSIKDFSFEPKVRTIIHNDVSAFSLGDRVNHAKFGIGTIVSIKENLADIAFTGGVGIKKMNIELAPIEKI
ncbi:MAG: 3'-5' exonuclease [Candidatus Gracilibacteria bacterium]|nr:3'-5' exonuclease [Candidatus Gracilibacteria bacterium]